MKTARTHLSVPTATVILEKRKQTRAETYPVTLRVNFNGHRKYYSLRHYVTEEAWKGIFKERKTDEDKALKSKVDTWQGKADDIIDKLQPFTFEAFELKYFGATPDRLDVIAAFQQKIDTLRRAGQEGNAVNYRCACGSFQKYMEHTGRASLRFTDITPGFLAKYEAWMLKALQRSQTTVSIYVRTVRTLYNEAITQQIVNREMYPFGRGKYEVSAGRNVKKALSLHEIARIFNYPAPEGSREQWARDMWLFSYLCNGMNMTDILRLRWRNVDIEQITFIRKKTEGKTRKNQRDIIVPMTPEIGRIIDRWARKEGNPASFVFPYLSGYSTPQEQFNRVKDITHQVNKYIDRIALATGIEKKVTTYTARHSFATVLKRSGASVAMISESLGHSSVLVTENYLASFELDIKRKFAAELTNFNRKQNEYE
ncbi:MAG TPA: site-specific integrase [Bacteroidales bacterium]|nr:site-specific integrase [Bacteroidales bacterium]HSA43751.1 site-specific integrase [Bacteroidales bacterium]